MTQFTSKTFQMVESLRKIGLSSYQNLGPLPNKAMFFKKEQDNQATLVSVSRIPNESSDYCWHVTLEGCSAQVPHQRNITTADYRVFLDLMIKNGFEQILELPWCRQRLYIKMTPQDVTPTELRVGEQILLHRLDDMPPWDVRLEDL